jgi:hypothetical protein
MKQQPDYASGQPVQMQQQPAIVQQQPMLAQNQQYSHGAVAGAPVVYGAPIGRGGYYQKYHTTWGTYSAPILFSALLLAAFGAFMLWAGLTKGSQSCGAPLALWLIVMGILILASFVITLAQLCLSRSPAPHICLGGMTGCLHSLVALGILGWLAYGCYLVFAQASSDSCDRQLYMFAFWSVIAMLISLAVSVCLSCLRCLCPTTQQNPMPIV